MAKSTSVGRQQTKQFTNPVKAQPLQLVTADDFWALFEQFEAAHGAKEGRLTLKEQIRNYKPFYDILVRHLQEIGTHSEGPGDGEFSTYADVDPNYATVVVCNTESVFRCGAIGAALAAITEAGTPHMVVFDTGSYIGVMPDGRVIGYSDWEDLLAQ